MSDPDEPQTKPRATCTAHCSVCGLHFHSTQAFDAHRVGKFSEPVGSDEGRRCLHPIEIIDSRGQRRLTEYSTDGICRIRQPQDGVTIWTMRQTPTEQERLSQLRRKPQTPSDT